MTRRELITLLGGAATASCSWPLAAHSQPQPKLLRVGFVGVQVRESPFYAAFLKRMADLGYREGRNLAFEYIQTPNIDGYEESYRQLAARGIDVFLAVGNERALQAALAAAEGRPIAFLAVDFDPLAKGYVANLSRPGGNVTGIFVRQLELAAKRVEIAREVFPNAVVVGIAFDTVSREQRDAAAVAALKLGLMPRMIEVKGQQGYGAAFDAMGDARGQPLVLPAGPMFIRDREAIAQALLQRRIPAIAAFRDRGIPGEHRGRSARQLRLRPHRAVRRYRRLRAPDCARRQTVRHADQGISALSHGHQSEDSCVARNFVVGRVHRPRQRGA